VVSGGDTRAGDPSIAAAADGAVHVAWSRLDVAAASRVKRRVVTGGALGGVVDVSAPAVSGSSAALATQGSVVAITWVETAIDDGTAAPDADAPGTVRVKVADQGVGTAPASDGGSPALASRPSGGFVLAYGDALPLPRVLVADVALAGSAVGPPAAISGVDLATEPQLAYDERGDGIATWRITPDPENAPEVGTPRAAGFDGAALEVLAVDVPAAAATGNSARLTATARDTWSAVELRWDFGDGTTATGAGVSHAWKAPGTYRVVLTAADSDGHQTTEERSVVVTDTPPVPAPTTSTAAPAAPAPLPPALSLTAFELSFRCLAEKARTGAPASVGFTLSEAATVTLTLQPRVESKPRATCPSTAARGLPGTLGPGVAEQIPGSSGPQTVVPQVLSLTMRSVPRRAVRRAARGRAVTTQAVRLAPRRLAAGRRRIVVPRQAARALRAGTWVASLTAVTADGRRAGGGLVKFWITIK